MKPTANYVWTSINRYYSHSFQISNQLFDFVLFVHEISGQSQTLLRVSQSFFGSLFHGSGFRLMSGRWTEKNF